MTHATVWRSLGLCLGIYAAITIFTGAYDRLATGAVIAALLAMARAWFDPDLKTNDPDIRPHYKETIR